VRERSPNLEPSVDDHLVGLDCVTGVTGLEGDIDELLLG